MWYADTSALAKLVLREPGSAALRAALRDAGELVASALVTTELTRAARRVRPDLGPRIAALLDTLFLVDLDRDILTAAAALPPPEVRTLDAIHVATALVLGDALDAVVTYDSRMGEAARAAGLAVIAPS